MAFTPVDLPIQEMLQTDFIVDLATIHNSNVLLLKDKLEDVINNFEIDTNTISMGVDNPINSIKVQDIVIQDGGFIFQTGTPNQIIARLEKNGSDESVLTVDNLVIDTGISSAAITTNTLTVNNTSTFTEGATFNGSLSYNAQLVESKETVTVNLERDTVNTDEANGIIPLSNTSPKNIYVTLSLETAGGATQAHTGSAIVSGVNKFNLVVDFDGTNPPAANSSFTIYIVDITRNDTSASLVDGTGGSGNDFAAVSSPELNIKPGDNNFAAAPILLHYGTGGLAGESKRLGYDFSLIPFKIYGATASFNYIVDKDSKDRLMITSNVGFDILDV